MTELVRKQAMTTIEAAKWQPIDTAPRDGSRFLAYIGNGTVTGAQYIAGKAFSADNLGFGNTEPTHWMPLPKPPAEH